MKFYRITQDFFKRYFSDEEAVILAFLIILFILLVYLLGRILAPVFIAIILAYLLSPFVDRLNRLRVPHVWSVTGLCLVFFGILITGLMLFIPATLRQVTTLAIELPSMLRLVQEQITTLPQRYPDVDSVLIIQQWLLKLDLQGIGQQMTGMIPKVLTFSLGTLPRVLKLLIYLIVIPLMVFFMLKDRDALWAGVKRALPDRRFLMNRIALEMNRQIANYIRGKVIEILIIGGVSYAVFEFFGMPYSVLLALMVGVSVIIPYIGATLVTIPVFAIALMQWGFSSPFYSVMIAYLIIQILDGNVLVPLLFSEAVNLNPNSIIVAVLVFGGLWGVWGVFFAIPLATFVKAIINAWPKNNEGSDEVPSLTCRS